MISSFKKLICLISVSLLVATAAIVPASAENDGRRLVETNGVTNSYTYSKVSGGTKVMSSPNTFLPSYVVDSESLKTELNNPSHITNHNGKLYIVNTGKNNILITDEKFNVLKILDSFKNGDKKDTFSAPQGCYVTEENLLYIADTGNKRIVVLDGNFKLVNLILQPESDVFTEDFEFKPQKVVVDTSDRVFVIADGVYEGIMQFYSDGAFIGFIGSIPVTANPLEIMWKKLLSKEQNAKRAQFVPVSYTNVFLDNEGFMYTVCLSTSLSEPIRRLNPGGGDILSRNALADTTVAGDQIGKTSQFTAICADDSGTYYAADSTNSRIFIYDEDGNLLNVFGGSYTGQIGTYRHISSVMLLGENLVVVDSQNSLITVLYPTDYMQCIKSGLATYRTGKYDESFKLWQKTISYNSNFDLAYSKMGMIEIRQKNYSEAMDYFKLANDQENYSRAYTKYRSIWYSDNLSYVITGIIAVIAIVVVFRVVRKRRMKK